MGSISGASNSDIPADERFYCGGGSSVRGYPYQEIGPYEDGEPSGGRSVIEISNELRWQWSRHLELHLSVQAKGVKPILRI